MRIIVTGAAGFVGRHLVAELTAEGYEVLGTDLREDAEQSTRDAHSLPFPSRYRRCDLVDAGETRELVSEWAPGAIIHLAAQSSASLSFLHPRETFEVNLFGSLSLLEAVRAIEADTGERIRIVSVGSCEEYGIKRPDEMPLTERSSIEPVSPYAVSKAAQSMLMLQYHKSFGLDVVVTKSFSHTGPGQTDRFVLPSFAHQCARIKAGESEAKLKVGNLDVTRDFLDVRDVVAAYRLLLEKGKSGNVYNVSRGEGLALRDALELLRAMTGVDVEIETDPELFRPADVPVLVGDCTKLRGDTGWSPSITVEGMLSGLFAYWEAAWRDY